MRDLHAAAFASTFTLSASMVGTLSRSRAVLRERVGLWRVPMGSGPSIFFQRYTQIAVNTVPMIVQAITA